MYSNKKFCILALFFFLVACSPKETDTIPTEVPTKIPTKVPTKIPTEKPAVGCRPTFNELDKDIVYISGIPEDMGIEMMGSADFNNDNAPDLLVARIKFGTQVYSPIDILLNDGNGRFRVATAELFPNGIPGLHHPTELLLEDFNNDGITDAYIADEGMDAPPFPGNQNTLFLSQPDGTFLNVSSTLPQRSDETHSAAVADIDLDGDMDLFVGNLGGGGVYSYILLNNGVGEFSIATNALADTMYNPYQNWITGSRFGDMNGDRYPDLLLGQAAMNQPSRIYLNDGTGNFASPPIDLPNPPLGGNGTGLDLDPIDINGDNSPDLLMIYTTNSYDTRYIQILINDGMGNFEDQSDARISQINSSDWFRFAHVVDFNNDNFPDFIAAPIGSRPKLHLNDGNGVFTPQNLNFDLYNYAVGDFNRDGKVDFMNAGDSYSGNPEFYATFLNQGCP